MKKYYHVKEIANDDFVGKVVKLRGWIYRIRGSKKLYFPVLRDVTGVIQCTVVKDEVNEDTWNNVNDLYIESSLEVEGTVRKDDRAPGGYELTVTNLKPVSVGKPFPITKDQSTEFLLDVRHLSLRTQRLSKVMKLRSHMVKYLRDFFHDEGFFELPPPLFTKNECEGGSQVFETDYFGEPAYLSESGQLYGEAMISSVEKVYVFAPSFRAEKSRTVRHLTEFWHLEPEMAWFNHEDNIAIQEKMLEYVVQNMIENHADLMQDFDCDLDELKQIKGKFPRITYDEMVDQLNAKGVNFKWGDDPGVEEEKILTQDNVKPLVVEKYPRGTKAFYMRADPENDKYVLNNDVLAPRGHGEIIGASERIWGLDELLDSMKLFNIDPKDPNYQWYIDLRRYGSVPHSGFGLGVERTLKWLLNLEHIRDTIPFPRVINRLRP